MKSPYMPEVQNRSDFPIEVSKDLIVCPHCYRGISHSEVTYSGGKGTNSPRFLCKACQKKFSVRHKSINWQAHYARLYNLLFLKPYEKSAIRARFNDFITESATRMFDRKFRQYRHTKVALEHAIERALLNTIKELQSKALKRINKNNRDNWDIIINHFNSEESYTLDWHLLQAENAGLLFSYKQNAANPLIHCHMCRNADIIRSGYSPIGRRRFLCKDCDITFILRAEHLFTFSYVKEELIEIFIRFNPENIKRKHMPRLEAVCHQMTIHFMRDNNLKRISKKLCTQFTVHEAYRRREIDAFANKISKHHPIIPMETLPISKQDQCVAKVFLLKEPKAEEFSVTDLFKRQNQEREQGLRTPNIKNKKGIKNGNFIIEDNGRSSRY